MSCGVRPVRAVASSRGGFQGLAGRTGGTCPMGGVPGRSRLARHVVGACSSGDDSEASEATMRQTLRGRATPCWRTPGRPSAPSRKRSDSSSMRMVQIQGTICSGWAFDRLTCSTKAAARPSGERSPKPSGNPTEPIGRGSERTTRPRSSISTSPSGVVPTSHPDDDHDPPSTSGSLRRPSPFGKTVSVHHDQTPGMVNSPPT